MGDDFEIDLAQAPEPVVFKLKLQNGDVLEYDPTVLLMKFYKRINLPVVDSSLGDQQVTALVEKHLNDLDPGLFHRAINSLFPEQVDLPLGVAQVVYMKIVEAAGEADSRLKKNGFLERSFAGFTAGNLQPSSDIPKESLEVTTSASQSCEQESC